MKRDWRLLLGILGVVIAGVMIGYDITDMMTYHHHWSINDHAYFEKRFGIEMPTNCFDCWPPLRTSFLECGLATLFVSLSVLIFAWWHPKQ
jgi:hypothetical protein